MLSPSVIAFAEAPEELQIASALCRVSPRSASSSVVRHVGHWHYSFVWYSTGSTRIHQVAHLNTKLRCAKAIHETVICSSFILAT